MASVTVDVLTDASLAAVQNDETRQLWVRAFEAAIAQSKAASGK